MWELHLESVLYLQKNKKIVEPSLFVDQKLHGLTVEQIRKGLNIYTPKSDVWGFGQIIGYRDSTLQNDEICILEMNSLNMSKNFNSTSDLFYLPIQCSLNRDLFAYVNIFATKKNCGYEVDSITSPIDLILTKTHAIDVTFGTKYLDEVKTLVPDDFSLEEMFYVGVADLLDMNETSAAKKISIPKSHRDTLYSIRKRYYEKIEEFQKKAK